MGFFETMKRWFLPEETTPVQNKVEEIANSGVDACDAARDFSEIPKSGKVVTFEFVSQIPIENVITCMNYKVDKVVFYGYNNGISNLKKNTTYFLKKYCGVKEVVFHVFNENDLPGILKKMRSVVEEELKEGNFIHCDVTGGESLMLVAFGILCNQYKLPMHQFDFVRNRFYEFQDGKLSDEPVVMRPQHVTMDLDMYIELSGAKINTALHKDIKSDGSEEYINDVKKIWAVASDDWECWNPFSHFLRNYMEPDENLHVSESMNSVKNGIVGSQGKRFNLDKLNKMIDKLERYGIIKNLERNRGRYEFDFKNKDVKDCIWEAGTVLELKTYFEEKKKSGDCRIGVHIDWDGIIHPDENIDVVNEIDVLSIKGNVVTFISCKSGKMDAKNSLHALYELDSVAKKFGDPYSKKVLVTTRPLGEVYMNRAKEMGIEVRN